MICYKDEEQPGKYQGTNTSLGMVKNHTYTVIISQEKTGIYELHAVHDLTENKDCDIYAQYGSEKGVLRNWELLNSTTHG